MVENIVRQWAREHSYPDDALRKYGNGEPTLVIIGENHYSRRCKREQTDLLHRLQPELVFHEAWTNYIYDQARKTIQRDTTHDIPAEVEKFMVEKRKYAWDIANPKQRKLFFKTRFGKWTQRERITHTIDRYDLTEVFIPIFKYPGVHQGMFLDVLPASVKFVIGSDLSRGEVNYLYDSFKPLQEPKYVHAEMPKTFEHEHWFLTRERRMGEIFSQYDSLRTRVAVQGSGHLREAGEYGCISASGIHNVLQSNGVSYLCFNQYTHPKSREDIAFEMQIADAYFWIEKHRTLLELHLENYASRIKEFFGRSE